MADFGNSSYLIEFYRRKRIKYANWQEGIWKCGIKN